MFQIYYIKELENMVWPCIREENEIGLLNAQQYYCHSPLFSLTNICSFHFSKPKWTFLANSITSVTKRKVAFSRTQLARGLLKKLEEGSLLSLGAKLVKALGANGKAISWKYRVFNKSCHCGRLQSADLEEFLKLGGGHWKSQMTFYSWEWLFFLKDF